jgi:hypothetical protein
MATKIDTGIVGTVEVAVPTFDRKTKTRKVKPVPMAIHDGETADDIRAFAQHLCDAWEAYRAKRRGGWLL